jgi:hypothetical protein
MYGGRILMNYTTVAQFYPFSADRGAAFSYSNYSGNTTYPHIHGFLIYNSIITGYNDDVVMVNQKNKNDTIPMYVNYSLLRTPKVANDTIFYHTIWETKDSVINGDKHFANVDINNLVYDFHLVEKSPAHKAAGKELPLSIDRNGIIRKDSIDIGCYQYIKKE